MSKRSYLVSARIDDDVVRTYIVDNAESAGDASAVAREHVEDVIHYDVQPAMQEHLSDADGFLDAEADGE